EMEYVRFRQQAGQGAELEQLSPPGRPGREVEVLVRLRVRRVRVEDDEARLDVTAAERLHVRPADAREIHGAVRYADRRGGTRGSPTSPLLSRIAHRTMRDLRRA